MPTETALVITGIVVVFAIFALTLAWTDLRTRHSSRPQ